MEQAAVFFITVPGPKMIWQFGELGYDYSIDFNGRVGDKPVRWDYLLDENRVKLMEVFKKLIALKDSMPVFSTTDFSFDFSGAIKSLTLLDPKDSVVIVGNFDIVEQDVTLDFPHTGIWFEYFTEKKLKVTGESANMRLKPGEYRMYVRSKSI
jgi:hypothetical protein